MGSNPSPDDSVPEIVLEVRKDLAAREDTTDFVFEEITKRSVIVKVHEQVDGEPQWRLYKVTLTEEIDGDGKKLHWNSFGRTSD